MRFVGEMRAARLALVLCAAASTGCLRDRCVAGSVRLLLSFDGPASAADRVEVKVTVDGASQTFTSSRTTGGARDTLQIDFPHYPAHEAIAIDVEASTQEGPVGAGHLEASLAPGCTALTLDVIGEQAGGDGGGDGDTDGGSGLVLLAGQLGGAGLADDTGGQARFDEPRGIAFVDGNLYVSDANNQVLRKIAADTGAVTTFAGTPDTPRSADGMGSAAGFNHPSGVASDGAGNLYVADTENQTIRRVVLATAQVSTLAGLAGNWGSTNGTGSVARFNQPAGLAFDDGKLYVSELGNHTIRVITVADGVVTTLAGTAGAPGATDGTGAAARFNHPWGLAVVGGYLYVSDQDNETIRKIETASGVVTTFAGTAGVADTLDGVGAGARFFHPRGLFADGADTLYVADGDNQILRRLTLSTAEVSTIAGAPKNIGFDDGVGGSARFDQPIGVTGDGKGHLFVTEEDNHDVRQVTLTNAQVTTLAGRATHDGATDGTDNARFDQPNGLAADDAGNLYVADTANHTVRRVDPTGTVTTIAGTAGMPGNNDGTGSGARFQKPLGVALDGPDELYVADTDNDTIRKIVLSTGLVTTIAGTPGQDGSSDVDAGELFHPTALAADHAGHLFVADRDNHTIRQIDLTSGALSTLAGTANMANSLDGIGPSARFDHPTGIAWDGAGNLFVADANNHTVRKIVVATGAVSTFAGAAGLSGSTDGTGGSARFLRPSAVVADGPGVLYVADQNQLVRRIELTSGAVTTLIGVPGRAGVRLGALPAGLNQPAGLALSPAGLALSVAAENAIVGTRSPLVSAGH